MKAEEIEHLCVMIHMSADRAHDDALNEIGYVNRLAKIAAAGGFVAPGSLEEMQLGKCVDYLLTAAKEIQQVRLNLLKNNKPDAYIKDIQDRMHVGVGDAGIPQ